MAKGVKRTARKTTGGTATLVPLNPQPPELPLHPSHPLPSDPVTSTALVSESLVTDLGESSFRVSDLVSAQNSSP